MKKQVWLCAVLCLALVAVFSASALAVELNGPTAVQEGDEVVITVESNDLSADVSTTGLKYDNVAIAENGTDADSQADEDSINLKGDPGVVTYTYTVTAAAGEDVSFTLVNIKEDGETLAEPVEWTTTVDAADDEAAAAADTDDTNAAASASADASATVTADSEPKTGDATMDLWVLTVLGAGLAAIAVVAARKAFVR